MIWVVIKNPQTGNFALIEKGAAFPDGWTVEVETANPDYLTQQALPTDEPVDVEV